jgi:hypothetical protein
MLPDPIRKVFVTANYIVKYFWASVAIFTSTFFTTVSFQEWRSTKKKWQKE